MQMEKQHWPMVSVVMPIRNESSSIGHSLSAVLRQDYPADRMEILVVDGMSEDETREVIRSTISQEQQDSASGTVHRPPVVILDNPSKIVPSALNIALRHARGEIIVRIDGHCEVAPDYVRCSAEALQRTGADGVGGLQRAVGKGLVGRAIALATSSPFGVGNARFHYSEEPGWTDTFFLGAYRREVFDRIGGFDEEMVRNQDGEFNSRLIQAGGKIWLEPSIRSVYHGRSRLGGLRRQYFQYGFYRVRTIQKRGAVPSRRQLVPAGFVVSLLASLLLAVLTGQPLWALSVAGPYVAANALASLWVARQDKRVLPILPLVFMTLHLAYGVGFVCGMWHWMRKPLQPVKVGL
jgi:succinoglycan biosynthesis protein ExoA